MAAGQKRVCLLTGAGGTLGTAFCRGLGGLYDIAAVYRQNPPLVATQNQRYLDPLEPDGRLPESEDAIFAIQADLRQESEIDRVVELALARFGRVDLLVNAAARYWPGEMIGGEAFFRGLSEQLHVNALLPVRVAVSLARECWRDREQENRERNRNVVNVSSISGVRVYPGVGQSGYSASKAALNALTVHMAHEFGKIGIRVNASAPNSFPKIVSTDAVVESIVALDQGEMTGSVVICDRRAEDSGTLAPRGDRARIVSRRDGAGRIASGGAAGRGSQL